MEQGQPIIILVAVGMFIALASAALSVSNFLAYNVAIGLIWMLVSELTAIFIGVVMLLSALHQVGNNE